MDRPNPRVFTQTLKGGLVGLLLLLPLVALGVWLLGRGQLANTATLQESLRTTALFSGIAAVVASMGIARAAHWASLHGETRRRTVLMATSRTAVAGIALAIIAAVARGGLPDERARWLWIVLLGSVGGAIAGAVIGFLCVRPARPQTSSPPPPDTAPASRSNPRVRFI